MIEIEPGHLAITTAEVADELKVSEGAIHQLVRRNKLLPWRRGSAREPNLFLLDDVMEFAQARRTSGAARQE